MRWMTTSGSNAEALLKKGAGFMLLERELSGERLAGMILELMENPETVAAWPENAPGAGPAGCGQVIVDEMTERQV